MVRVYEFLDGVFEIFVRYLRSVPLSSPKTSQNSINQLFRSTLQLLPVLRRFCAIKRDNGRGDKKVGSVQHGFYYDLQKLETPFKFLFMVA